MGLLKERQDGIRTSRHSSILSQMYPDETGRKKTAAEAKKDKGTVSKYYQEAYPEGYGKEFSKEYGDKAGETEKGTTRVQEKLPSVKVKMMAPGKMAEEKGKAVKTAQEEEQTEEKVEEQSVEQTEEKVEARFAQATAEEIKKNSDRVLFCEHCGNRLRKAAPNKKQPSSTREQIEKEMPLEKEKVDKLSPGQMHKTKKSDKIILPFSKRIASHFNPVGLNLYRKHYQNGTSAIWEVFEEDDGTRYIVKKSREGEEL